MQRVTITLDDDLLEAIDKVVLERGYQGRSEAFRDLARAGLQQVADAKADNAECVAAVVYVYDHAARDLSQRLVGQYHAHHDVTLATLHVHLDHDNCMELTALKGKTADVKHLAEHIIAERGVRYGQLVVMPAEAIPAPHSTAHHHHRQAKRPGAKKRIA